MSVSFKVIERGEPGVKGGGEKKFYASVVSNGEVDINDLTASIEKTSTVNGADIRAVIYGLLETIESELAKGNIVRLGELGNFRISASSEGFSKVEEVNAKSIKSSKILFAPGNRLKKLLTNLQYKKA